MVAWDKRERSRIEAGKYKLPPWSGEWWATTEVTRYHFARLVGRKNKREVGFFTGGRDKLIQMRPGRYLKKFYSHVLSAAQVKGWVDDVELLDVKLHFASSPAEIARVYENGPSSCMSGSFPKEVMHPAAVYGAGDLAVAYIKGNKKITARVLCWPDKKVYLGKAVYGDKRIARLLTRHGYRKSRKKDPEFRGARLLAVPVGVGFLTPDISARCSRVQLCDDGFLRLRQTAGEWACFGEATVFTLEEAKAAGLEIA